MQGYDGVPGVAQLLSFEAEVVKILAPLPVKSSEPIVTVVLGVIRPLRNRVQDRVVREVGKGGVHASRRIGGVGPPHDLNVLLRHRLLAQPGGFEGFGHVRVHLHPDRLSVPERPHLSEAHVDGDSRGLRTPPLVDDDDDALPGVDEVLGLKLPTFPRIRPLGEELVRTLGPGVDLFVRPADLDTSQTRSGFGPISPVAANRS